MNTAPFANMVDAYHDVKRAGWNLSKLVLSDILKWDRERLFSEDAPKRFAWVLSENGTLLIDPRASVDTIRGFIAHLESNREERARCYRWRLFWCPGAGSTLREVDLDTLARNLRAENFSFHNAGKPAPESASWY